MTNTCLKGKKILIFQQRGWGVNIGHFLAKKLQAEGALLSALTFKPSTHKFITEQKEVRYELVLNHDDIIGNPKEYLAGHKYSLEKICETLGVDSVWPIVQSLRNHVKSYGQKYYYGFTQNVPDEEIVDYVQAAYKCASAFFEKFKPDIIITPNFVALPHVFFNLYAKRVGVPMFAVTDSKIKGNYIFSQSFNDDEGAFYERVAELNRGKKDSPNRERAKKYIEETRVNFKMPDYVKQEKEKTFISRIRHILSPFYHIFLWYTEHQSKHPESTGVTPDYRPPRIILRDHFARDFNKKAAEKFPYFPIENAGRFVYFPLQFQPEATIDVIAPHFNNQIETARQIAMSLPGDYTLVVKEHPAMVGLRPLSYLRKISLTPNIKLVDYRIPSEKVLKLADLVVSPNSTTLAEAAFLRKPAIQLGNLGTTLALPNVWKHTDMTTLSSKIKEVLSVDLNTAEYDRRLENFVSAAFDAGFDVDYVKMWEEGDKTKSEELWSAYKNEICRLISRKNAARKK